MAILVIVLAAGQVLSSSGAIALVNESGSAYRIVLAAGAIPSERHAAEELQHYLEKMTGAKLPIVTDLEKPVPQEILLGDNAHLRQLGLKLDFEKLGPDGFVLRTDHERLIIAGNRPRGTLNGVYSLLEEKLGVRWFTPKVEFVPVTDRLILPALAEIQVPPLENREVFWTELLQDIGFAARHHLNGAHYELTEEQGGGAAVYYPFVHSMDLLIPPELYQEHPEYFPLINGKRVNGYVQRCLSNPEVLRLAKARVREWIRQHPEAGIISVSQNDTGNWCQCEQCKALDDQEGSPAASLLRFVNAIAEDIEHDYPNVRIDTLAYQFSRKPPKTIRPRSNVIVRLCSIECCFSHPLAVCASPENRGFHDDLVAWHAIAPVLYVWDYTTDFANYQQPFPNLAALQPNVQFFVRNGVKGLFEEGNYSTGGGGELGPLRAYVLAETLWNPDTDVPRHIQEFLHGYYGQAAPELQGYVDLLQKQVRNDGMHAHIYDPPQAAYLDEKFLKRADELLTQGESAAENEAIRFRVQVAHLPVWYVQIATGRVTGTARAALLNHFLAIARQAGISNINESQLLDDWAKQMAAKPG
jgi:hypothetical protein